MLNFLKQYTKATDLDNEWYDHLFSQGIRRSDFLLFNETCVCEFKDLCKFDIKSRIEHVAKKETTTELNLKRDVYNTVEKNLSKANTQIKDTKQALNKPEATGLIIIQNHIQNDFTGLSLFDAASRKMKNGLDSTDGILCLDFENILNAQNEFRHRLIQLVISEEKGKETEKTKELCNLVEVLMSDFCKNKGFPIHLGFDTQDIEQQWSLNTFGQYKSYSGRVNIERGKSFGDKLRFNKKKK